MLQEVNRIEKRNHLWEVECGFEMLFFPLMKPIKQGFVFFSFINSLTGKVLLHQNQQKTC